MKLDITKKLELSSYGEGWENCFIAFSPISVKEARKFLDFDGKQGELIDLGIDLLKDKFVGGKVLSGGKEVELKSEDLEDMPVELITRGINLLTEEEDQKKE